MSTVRFFDNSFTGAQRRNLSAEQIIFITTSNTAVSTNVVENVATFPNRFILTPPSGFFLDEDSFTVYVNGVSINPVHVFIEQVGTSIKATFDPSLIGYNINGGDTVVLTGKLR